MHFNKVVVIQSPVMIDINNSRSWRVKFYTDTGSSWTTVFLGGDELIILHGKKILWDKIGETAVKWISVAKIGEQWARTWVKSSFSCNSKLSSWNMPKHSTGPWMFQKILVFSIHLYPGNLSKVCLGQCMFWLPSLTHQTMIHKINRKHPKMEKPLQEWTSVTDGLTVGLSRVNSLCSCNS